MQAQDGFLQLLGVVDWLTGMFAINCGISGGMLADDAMVESSWCELRDYDALSECSGLFQYGNFPSLSCYVGRTHYWTMFSACCGLARLNDAMIGLIGPNSRECIDRKGIPLHPL